MAVGLPRAVNGNCPQVRSNVWPLEECLFVVFTRLRVLINFDKPKMFTVLVSQVAQTYVTAMSRWHWDSLNLCYLTKLSVICLQMGALYMYTEKWVNQAVGLPHDIPCDQAFLYPLMSGVATSDRVVEVILYRSTAITNSIKSSLALVRKEKQEENNFLHGLFSPW